MLGIQNRIRYNHYSQKVHFRLVVLQKYILSKVKMPTVKIKLTAAKYVDIKTNEKESVLSCCNKISRPLKNKNVWSDAAFQINIQVNYVNHYKILGQKDLRGESK